MHRGRLNHYIPAMMLALFGLVFLIFPFLAVFLVVTALFTLALIYAWVIHRFHRYQDLNGVYEVNTGLFESEFKNWQEPSFKNMTVTIVKQWH